MARMGSCLIARLAGFQGEVWLDDMPYASPAVLGLQGMDWIG